MSYSPLTTAELDRYFARIAYQGSPRADIGTLAALHYLHPLAIPFENLDSWSGHTPLLDEAAVFTKLVDAGRGGYCFEHNQLFLRALLALGFNVQTLAARVIQPGQPLPRTHKVLLIQTGQGPVLADVGFGGMTMSAPLQLYLRGQQTTPHEPWQIEADDNEYVTSAQVLGEWSPKFRFSLQPQTTRDYEMANWYVANHPSSRFRNDLIAARVSAAGRHALLNTRLMFHQHNQGSEQTELGSPAEVAAALNQVFGINTTAIIGLEQKLAKLFTDS